MEDRFSWKQMPDTYYASYYNNKDVEAGRKFMIIDNYTKVRYPFPLYKNENRLGYKNPNAIFIDPDLWRPEFFEWISRTAPDFCVHIPPEFMTPTLIDICIENSSDPQFIKHIPNVTQEQCINFVKKVPRAITEIPEAYITIEMIEEAVSKDLTLLTDIPRHLAPIEIYQKWYQKSDLKTQEALIGYGCMKNALTRDMLLEGINQNIGMKKGILNDYVWKEVPKEIIDQEISEKMFQKNTNFIFYMPETFITYDMAYQALSQNGRVIAILPPRLQNLEFQKMAIDQSVKNLAHIPKTCLSDAIILYTLQKNGLALSYVPMERRTLEFCKLAISNTVGAFPFVPDICKNYEMCKKVVTLDPKQMKKVPVEILTRNFLNELPYDDMILSQEDRNYVAYCLEIHDRIEHVIEEENRHSKPSEIEDVTMESIEPFFSGSTMIQLENYGITSVEQLLNIIKSPTFLKDFENTVIFNELINTIPLLRCKYWGEDPHIDIYDEQMNINDLYRKMGFSTRCVNNLNRCKFSQNAKQFFERMREDEVEKALLKIRNLGQKAVLEIMQKSYIVLRYYDQSPIENQPLESSVSEKIESLEELKAELETLRGQRKRIDQQIDIIIQKIEEKITESAKTYILK